MGDVQEAYRRRRRTYMIGSKVAWLSNFELFESSNKGNSSN